LNGILFFAQEIDREDTVRDTYLMKRNNTLFVKIKNARDSAGRGKTAFVPRLLSVAAAKSREELLSNLVFVSSMMMFSLLFIPTEALHKMSDLYGFERMFRLDGKVALITGGKQCTLDTRHDLINLHRLARARLACSYGFSESRSAQSFHHSEKD
jgi:hypothetical protein